MIKDLSFSAYIIPFRNGQVAILGYDENGYGPIGGHLSEFAVDFLYAHELDKC